MEKTNKCLVIINEQHKLLKEQEEILNDYFSEIEFIKAPADGWNKKEMEDVITSITGRKVEEIAGETLYYYTHQKKPIFVVFVSPIPYLLKELARQEDIGITTYVFHNDNRTKKELPNGKIISVVAEEGWELL